MKPYVHGYSSRETRRLYDQAATLERLLHADSLYPAGSSVLEAGCGTGAQTVILAKNSPRASFVSMDISETSLAQARERARRAGLRNVRFAHGDIFHAPFARAGFNHIFVCFVLEHLGDPAAALRSLRGLLKKGGTLTVIEGDHGSAYFHPRSETALRTIRCLIELQRAAGGNPLIGRELFPLLKAARFRNVAVSPRMVYVDRSRPELVRGFTRDTFIAMVRGVGKEAAAKGLMTKREWDSGIRDLERTMGPDGTFCYTFFKATAVK